MVTKKIEVEHKYCDVENCNEIASFTCIGCRKDYCFEHHKIHGRELISGVFARSTSKDAFICNGCYTNRIELDDLATDLLVDYSLVQQLDKKYDEMYDEISIEDKRLQKSIALNYNKWKSQKVNENE